MGCKNCEHFSVFVKMWHAEGRCKHLKKGKVGLVFRVDSSSDYCVEVDPETPGWCPLLVPEDCPVG